MNVGLRLRVPATAVETWLADEKGDPAILASPEVLKLVRGGAVHRAETTMTDANDQETSYRVAEIHRLAETVNAMLDRLDRGFQFQTRLFQDLFHLRSADEYRAILESNLDEVARMTHLIEGLLLLARLDSPQVVLQTKTVDWGASCPRWAEDFSLLWEAKSLTVEWDLQDPLPVLVDPDRRGQALLNRLDNAVKHSPVGGRLSARVDSAHGRAVFDLCNQGPPLVR